MISIYLLPILASALYAMALSFLGTHLAARDRSMQTLCVSQGAMFGTLIGIGVAQQWLHPQSSGVAYPFVISVCGSVVTFFASEAFLGKNSASKNTYFAAIFSLLVSLSYMASSLFPGLESHMAQRYFGDLATVSDGESKLIAAVALSTLVVVFWKWKTIAQESFDSAILGSQAIVLTSWFGLVSLVNIALSVQVLGFLFTISCLFLPTTIVSRKRSPGFWSHTRLCMLVSAGGTIFGFGLSIFYDSLPTVPAIVLSIAGFSFLTILFLTIY